MKRYLTLIASTVFAVLLLSLSQAHAAREGYVTRDVNLRTGPGTRYGIIAVVPRRAIVTVLSCTYNRSWCGVDFDGIDGWISGRYIRIIGRVSRPEIVVPPIIVPRPRVYRRPRYVRPPIYRPPVYQPRIYDRRVRPPRNSGRRIYRSGPRVGGRSRSGPMQRRPRLRGVPPNTWRARPGRRYRR